MASEWFPKEYSKKMKEEPLRRFSNPVIAKEIHIPDQGPHIGLGLDWLKQVII